MSSKKTAKKSQGQPLEPFIILGFIGVVATMIVGVGIASLNDTTKRTATATLVTAEAAQVRQDIQEINDRMSASRSEVNEYDVCPGQLNARLGRIETALGIKPHATAVITFGRGE